VKNFPEAGDHAKMAGTPNRIVKPEREISKEGEEHKLLSDLGKGKRISGNGGLRTNSGASAKNGGCKGNLLQGRQN